MRRPSASPIRGCRNFYRRRACAIDRAVLRRQGDGSLFNLSQGILNRGKARARYEAPLRRLRRQVLRPEQGPDHLPEVRHGVRGRRGRAARTSGRGRRRGARRRRAAGRSRRLPEPQEAEFVSLEEADAEAEGAKKPAGRAPRSRTSRSRRWRAATTTTRPSSRRPRKRTPTSPRSSAATSRTRKRLEVAPVVVTRRVMAAKSRFAILSDSAKAMFRRGCPNAACDGGAIAQLGERLNGIQEVGGSIPPGSTSLRPPWGLRLASQPSQTQPSREKRGRRLPAVARGRGGRPVDEGPQRPMTYVYFSKVSSEHYVGIPMTCARLRAQRRSVAAQPNSSRGVSSPTSRSPIEKAVAFERYLKTRRRASPRNGCDDTAP